MIQATEPAVRTTRIQGHRERRKRRQTALRPRPLSDGCDHRARARGPASTLPRGAVVAATDTPRRRPVAGGEWPAPMARARAMPAGCPRARLGPGSRPRRTRCRHELAELSCHRRPARRHEPAPSQDFSPRIPRCTSRCSEEVHSSTCTTSAAWTGIGRTSPPDEAASQFRAIGEVTPDYLASDQAPGRSSSCCPSAACIAILRNPVEQAWSDYRHRRRSRNERRDFKAFLDDPAALGSGSTITIWREYLALFQRDALLVLIYEELVQDPGASSAG